MSLISVSGDTSVVAFSERESQAFGAIRFSCLQPGPRRTRRFRLLLLAVVALLTWAACSHPAAQKDGNGNPESPVEETALWESSGDPDYVSPHGVEIDAASLSNQSEGLPADWYRDSAFYHIWVKSFSDSNNDGCGDLDGITAKLSYIQGTLGCDALWLSPIFECAGKGTSANYNMHGYDTVDYYAINSLFGTEADAVELLAAAHDRGMKVIFDFVPNHTSTSSPWFSDSARNRNGKGDWYLWQNASLPWNPMGSSATWYENATRGQFYYAPFWSGMSDLNFRNVEVREEMKNAARYWLNLGFDGMRIDAVRYLVEERSQWADTAATHQWFSELRTEVVDAYTGLGHPKFMVGEAWINGNRPLLETYFGRADRPEFQMLFDFDFASAVFWAVTDQYDGVASALYDRPLYADSGTVASFLSNHDNLSSRPASIYTDPYELRLATALSLLRPTVPFIYYGNEIGQQDAPGYGSQDIRLRYPFDWSLAGSQFVPSTGLPGIDPVAAVEGSLLAYHSGLLALREAHSALRRGIPTLLFAPDGDDLSAGVVAYALTDGSETLVCVFNLSASPSASPIEMDLSSLSGIAGCTPLFGNPEGASLSGGTLALDGLPSRAARLYRLDTPTAAPSPEIVIQECADNRMFLRGTMNGWSTSLPMTRDESFGEELWFIELSFPAGTQYSFKLDASGATTSWPADSNWGAVAGNQTLSPDGSQPLALILAGENVNWTPSVAGRWRVSFNRNELTLMVSLLES